MPEDRSRYLSYLVRLWQVKSRQGWNWQASLESPMNGERLGFPDLDQLFAFLQARTQQLTMADEATHKRNIDDDGNCSGVIARSVVCDEAIPCDADEIASQTDARNDVRLSSYDSERETT